MPPRVSDPQHRDLEPFTASLGSLRRRGGEPFDDDLHATSIPSASITASVQPSGPQPARRSSARRRLIVGCRCVGLAGHGRNVARGWRGRAPVVKTTRRERTPGHPVPMLHTPTLRRRAKRADRGGRLRLWWGGAATGGEGGAENVLCASIPPLLPPFSQVTLASHCWRTAKPTSDHVLARSLAIQQGTSHVRDCCTPICRIASVMPWPCETRTSTWRSFATISSGL